MFIAIIFCFWLLSLTTKIPLFCLANIHAVMVLPIARPPECSLVYSSLIQTASIEILRLGLPEACPEPIAKNSNGSQSAPRSSQAIT